MYYRRKSGKSNQKTIGQTDGEREMSISIMLLAYKEAENLKRLIPLIKENVEKMEDDYEIVVIDAEKEMDETPQICREYGIRYVNQQHSGFGGAFRDGIEEVKKDEVLTMDSDGSHDPNDISSIIKMFYQEKLDIGIGSRYIKGGVTNDTKISVAMSLILNTVFRVCLGIPVKDLSTNYRMYHTEDLKGLELKCKNYDVLQEILIKIQKRRGYKLKYGEVPISFKKRIFGKTKRHLFLFIISYIKTLCYLVAIK